MDDKPEFSDVARAPLGASVDNRIRGRRATREILMVAELFPPAIGGSAELFANIYSRMENHRTTVLTSTPGPSDDDSSPIRVIRTGCVVPWGIAGPRQFAQQLMAVARIRRHSSARHTIVHTARVLPEGLAAMLARGAAGAPFLCWAHGEELAYFEQSRELRALRSLVFRAASALIANSNNTAGLLKAAGAPGDQIRVVHPGVDVERFRPGVPGADAIRSRLLGSGSLLLLCVARLQRRKGHDLVIRALTGLRGQFPGLRFAIVGDGEERLRLEELASACGVSDVVTFVGRVSSEKLPAYYAAGDIFVHPNRVEGDDFEGFGIALLEAAATGLPVIGGNSGGAPEAVAEGETALLVSGNDVDELQRALTTLIEAPERRQAMGLAGRARAARDFSWKRAALAVAAVHANIGR